MSPVSFFARSSCSLCYLLFRSLKSLRSLHGHERDGNPVYEIVTSGSITSVSGSVGRWTCPRPDIYNTLMPPAREFVIVSTLIVSSVLGGLGYTRFTAEVANAKTHNHLEAIKECTKGQEKIACSRSHIKALMDTQSAKDIAGGLEKTLAPSSCHYMTHVLGQELYRKYKDAETAISTCGRQCGGCIHGAVGEALYVEIGLTDAEFDPAHLSVDEILTLGKRLCGSQSACHGVGHALFQIFKTPESAVDICDEISQGKERPFCFRGIFMEYHDEISSSSYREGASLAIPAPHELLKICEQENIEARRACFQFLPEIAHEIFLKQGDAREIVRQKVRDMCLGISDTKRHSECLVGFGIAYGGRAMSDPSAMGKECESFESLQEQKSCAFGTIFYMPQYKKYSQMLAFCSAFADASVRKACFQSAFYTTDNIGLRVSDAEDHCKTGDLECHANAKDFKHDPWALILR